MKRLRGRKGWQDEKITVADVNVARRDDGAAQPSEGRLLMREGRQSMVVGHPDKC